MNKNDANVNGSPSPSSPTFSETNIAQARECFRRAQDLASKKNYDYAIEMYISGLEHWPEAVDEGHNPCRAAALFRGGKKISFTDGIKYKTSGKDSKKAMLNAERLLARDPRNIGYMEALFKNASKAHYNKTTMWIGEILGDAAAREDKPSPGRFMLLRQIYEELADRCQDTDLPMAIEAMDRAVQALSRLRNLKPHDGELGTALRDVAGKLTILKGKYASAESFKDSVQNTDLQKDLHDKDRLVQSEDRLGELIAQAQTTYEADPTNHRAVNAFVDLLCRRETTEEEAKAIGVLVKAYKATQEYRFKLRADDIRMKQLRRQAREVAETRDKKAAREHFINQLKFELSVFKERMKHYPTDLRWQFEYGRRLFEARHYDDAIPVLQGARNEPKTRIQCSLYIGRCFYEKGFYGQAADVFRETLEKHETPDDPLGRELHYWLGRAMEDDGKVDDALKIYGQLLQWDYNYRKGDVRKRYEVLKGQQ